MKQRITVEQLNELSDAQKQRLRELWEPQDGDFIYSAKHGHTEFLEVAPMRGHGDYLKNRDKSLPLLSIGQMIEILVKDDDFFNINQMYDSWRIDKIYNKELCDALWQAVKEIL